MAVAAAPERSEGNDAVRNRANLRLAIVLGLVAVAFYLGFILLHLIP
jgi:hypothetical protein